MLLQNADQEGLHQRKKGPAVTANIRKTNKKKGGFVRRVNSSAFLFYVVPLEIR